MEDLKRNWFNGKEIDCFTVIIFCMIITELDIRDQREKHIISKTQYVNVLNTLRIDQVISDREYNQLKEDYNRLDNGTIDSFIRNVSTVSNNPNLINNKWISDNTIGNIKNRCFPCRQKIKSRNK